MSIVKQIETLEELVDIDRELKELTEGVSNHRGELDQVAEEVSILDERIEADGASISEMEKTRSDLVQEVRQLGDQISRSRDRLQRARNSRETNAAEREVKELGELRRDRDHEIKKLGDLSDQARENVMQAEERKKELESRLAGSIEGTTKTIQDLEARLDALRARRDGVKGKLPRLLMRRYERMMERRGSAVAKTHDGTCLGCYVQLPPMLFTQMLSQTRFEECPMCHRIIYYTPKPDPAEASEGDDEGEDADAASDAGRDGGDDAVAASAEDGAAAP
ncbi:MAG: hypothetical protein AAGN82_23540 [Myxococcota bacterium]